MADTSIDGKNFQRAALAYGVGLIIFWFWFLICAGMPPDSRLKELFWGEDHFRPLWWWLPALVPLWVFALRKGAFTVREGESRFAPFHRTVILLYVTYFLSTSLLPRTTGAKVVAVGLFVLLVMSIGIRLYERKEDRKVFAVVLAALFVTGAIGYMAYRSAQGGI